MDRLADCLHSSRPLASGYPFHAHSVGLGVYRAAPGATSVVGEARVALPEGVTRHLALEGRPIEVLGVLGKHLEADEVGIFKADKGTVHKDVALFVHQLAETV